MKKTIKFISYLLIAVIFSIALSGCGKKQQQVDPNANKLVVWSFESEDAWKAIAKEYEKKVPGGKLIYQKQTLDQNYETRALNSMVSGQGPDIWAMPNDWVYRHKEKLLPMSENGAKNYNIDNTLVRSVKQSVVIDGKVYALAPAAQPLMIYYNQKLFSKALEEYSRDNKDKAAVERAQKLLSEPPKIWSDYVEAVKLLTKKENNKIVQSGAALGTSSIANSQDILYLLMMQNETDILSSNLKLATFNLPKDTATGTKDAPGKRALEFYTSFSTPSSANYSWDDSLGKDIDAFVNGKVAMIFAYNEIENTFLQKYPTFTDYRKAFVPQLGIENDKIVDFARFNTFSVSKLSKYQGAAWTLISTIMEQSDNLNSITRLYTSKKASNYDVSLQNRSGSNPEKLALATARSLVKGRYPADFDQIVKNAIDAVNTGRQNPQSALDLSANNITEILRKETW